MSNKNLILLLVILFFLGCSFSCNGLKENFECQKNKQLCGDILEMEGGEETEGAIETTCGKTRTIDGTKTNICDTCDFCKNKDKVVENFGCEKETCNEFLKYLDDKKIVCDITINDKKTCDTCDFCSADNKDDEEDEVTENFTLGRRRRHYKTVRHVSDCIECMNNCDETHCQINAGWCLEKLPEYKEKCNVN